MNAYIYLFVFGAFNGILIDLLGNLFIFGFGSLGPPYFEALITTEEKHFAI